MPPVVGVKLRSIPKTLWFDPGDNEPAVGDSVVVETERGIEMGLVVEARHEVELRDLPAPLKPVKRIATSEDLEAAAALAEREVTARKRFRELIKAHELDMKPIDVEFLFGGDKAIFYFSAEERVDFRELVRELAGEFKVRIDMRQIGVRDGARMLGGLGHCGEQLCCVRFGGEFQPVSIRMAKEQDLPLNPLKISGLCGRLMCCLRYEFEAYKDFKARAPKRGATVETPLGEGKVVELNTPRETVTVHVSEVGTMSVPLSSMECCSGKGCPCSISRAALDEAGVSLPALVAPGLEGGRSETGASERGQGEQGQGRQSGGGLLELEPSTPALDNTRELRSRSGRRKRDRLSVEESKRCDVLADQTGQAAQAPQPQAPKPSGRRRRRRRSGGGGAGKAE